MEQNAVYCICFSRIFYLGFYIQHEIIQRKDNSRSPGTPEVIVVISVSFIGIRPIKCSTTKKELSQLGWNAGNPTTQL